MNDKEKFELANSSDFYIALMNFEDTVPRLQTRPFQTIKDRENLIDLLEKQGFHIVRKSTLVDLRTTLNDLAQTGSDSNYDCAMTEINKINKILE